MPYSLDFFFFGCSQVLPLVLDVSGACPRTGALLNPHKCGSRYSVWNLIVGKQVLHPGFTGAKSALMPSLLLVIWRGFLFSCATLLAMCSVFRADYMKQGRKTIGLLRFFFVFFTIINDIFKHLIDAVADFILRAAYGIGQLHSHKPHGLFLEPSLPKG